MPVTHEACTEAAAGAADLMTRDEARRMAANFAKLPELLRCERLAPPL